MNVRMSEHLYAFLFKIGASVIGENAADGR